MVDLKIIENSSGITDVSGFQVSGVSSDVRNNGSDRLDTGIIYSKAPAIAAGVFTQNDIKAAPVRFCMEQLESIEFFHGVLVNSGNANACTGSQGMIDARDMVKIAEQSLAAPKNSFLVASTGRIGELLPMDRLRIGIEEAAKEVSYDPESGHNLANSILTSDTKSKLCSVCFEHAGKKITVGGIAKGAGMIEPNMATMLSFLATDLHVPQEILQKVLVQAVGESFNSITIDGDMSTNDTVLLLSNGMSGLVLKDFEQELLEKFTQAVSFVSRNLASKIVGDGEKITHVVELSIQGAKNIDAAEKVARAIGNSLLVKTSWFGNDPNWGRLVDSAGYARVAIEEEKLDIFYEQIPVLIHGSPIYENKPKWKEVVCRKNFKISIHLNQGDACYTLLTTDLSEEYVNFNRSE